MIVRALVNVAKWLGVIASILIVPLLIVGGGFGKKEELPPHLKPILKFAHRGGGTPKIPENTLASAKSMDGKGFSGLEIDIQKTSDGKFILFHDEETNRLLRIRGNASEMTYAELQKHNIALQDFSGNTSKQKVALLDEIINAHKSKYIFYFDMKGYGSASPFHLAEEIANYIESRGLQDRVLVANSNFLFAAYLEYRHPQIRTVLEGFNPSLRTLYFIIPRDFKTDFIAGPEEDFTPEFANWLKQSDLMDRYILFDLNAVTIKRVVDMGLKNFMVDYSPALDSYLRK